MTLAENQPPRTHSSDVELVRSALEGSATATGRLAERLRYVPTVLAGLNARRGRPFSNQDLEDLSQDVIVRIWQKLVTFGGRSTLESWFFGFCYLEFMNRLRKRSRQPASDPDQLDALPARSGDEPGQLADLLVRLQALSAAESELVLAKHLEDLTFEELSERTGVVTNTIKARYYRALDKLRERLGQTGAEEWS